MQSELTPSELAIVSEIVSAQSMEELILLGQRLDFIHSFSQYSFLLALGILLIIIFSSFKLVKLNSISTLYTGIICLLLPAIPMRYLGEIFLIPIFTLIGIIAIIASTYSLIREISSLISRVDDE